LNGRPTAFLIIITTAWCVLCLLITWRVLLDLQRARRRQKTIEERGIDGTLAIVARYSTRATWHDLWTVLGFGGGAVLLLIVRYLHGHIPYWPDQIFRTFSTIIFVLALVPFYMRVNDRLRVAEEMERYEPPHLESDDALYRIEANVREIHHDLRNVSHSERQTILGKVDDIRAAVIQEHREHLEEMREDAAEQLDELREEVSDKLDDAINGDSEGTDERENPPRE
jgi:hypothetical protein